jgi:hypothetical protein
MVNRSQWLWTCPVSCFDLKQVKHTVEVSVGSDYRAVVQALRIFRDNEWVEDTFPVLEKTLALATSILGEARPERPETVGRMLTIMLR